MKSLIDYIKSQSVNESKMNNSQFWKIMDKIKKENGGTNFEGAEETFTLLYNKVFNGNKDEAIAFGEVFFDKAVMLQDKCEADGHDDDIEYQSWDRVLKCKDEAEYKSVLKSGWFDGDEENGENFAYGVPASEADWEDNCDEFDLE